MARLTALLAHLRAEPRALEVYGHTSLRGLAALGVVGYHAALITLDVGEGAPDLVSRFFLHAFLFVDLFFMLSGFIMVEAYGDALSRTGRKMADIVMYWRKRAAKILPNYYTWLVIAIVVFMVRAAYFGSDQLSAECVGISVVQHLVLIQPFVVACVEFNTPLWSIVVELIAYLLFPALILAVRFWPVLCAVSLAIYGGLWASWGTFDLLSNQEAVLRCLAGFMIGMSLARLLPQLPDWLVGGAQIPAFLGMVLAMSFGAEAPALCLIGATVLLTGRNYGALVRLLRWGLFYVLGRASFSIYLCHVPMLAVLNVVLTKVEAELGLPLASDWRVFVPLCILMASFVGTVSYVMIEQRFEVGQTLRRKATSKPAG